MQTQAEEGGVGCEEVGNLVEATESDGGRGLTGVHIADGGHISERLKENSEWGWLRQGCRLRNRHPGVG